MPILHVTVKWDDMNDPICIDFVGTQKPEIDNILQDMINAGETAGFYNGLHTWLTSFTQEAVSYAVYTETPHCQDAGFISGLLTAEFFGGPYHSILMSPEYRAMTTGKGRQHEICPD